MKLLLTSGGIKNPSLHRALVEMLPKPIEECKALAISAASFTGPNGFEMAMKFYNGTAETPMLDLGWKSSGIIELSILPSLDKEVWQSQLRQADVLLVNGGDPLFLNYWMLKSGLADFFTELNDLVYVGLSAGSMVMTPRIGEDFVNWKPENGDDKTLGIVDFAIFPHLEHPKLTENTMAAAEEWAEKLGFRCYAIDDDTGIKVVDGKTEVISEGKWHEFNA